jgi:pseudaminic acid cytidylyltransferase
LANDHAATLPVIAHAIRWWEENRAPVEFACCIYATAPFLRAEFLRDGFRILKEKLDAEFAFSCHQLRISDLPGNPDWRKR